jgi:hypothetical protein
MTEVFDLNDINCAGEYKFSGQNAPEPLKYKWHVEWISVDLHMPTEPRACWLTCEDGVIPAVGLYKPDLKCWEIFPPATRYTTAYITHWAPVEIDQ